MICTMITLLEKADKEKRAVGSFTVSNMEIAMGVIRAAEAKQTGIIVQIAEGRLAHTPLDYIGPLLVQAAKDACVPVCVHLDHGQTVERAKEALSYGFTSIMYDGSALTFEENVHNTNEVAKVARQYGASIEAELGSIGGKEATDRVEQVIYTDPEEARRFAEATDIDALAVAIGNSHGHYKGTPRLNYEILDRVHHQVKPYLVLHGGSGISDQDFQHTIDLGIRKINIATANLDALTYAAERYLRTDGEHNFYDLNNCEVNAVRESTEHLIDVFNN